MRLELVIDCTITNEVENNNSFYYQAMAYF